MTEDSFLRSGVICITWGCLVKVVSWYFKGLYLKKSKYLHDADDMKCVVSNIRLDLTLIGVVACSYEKYLRGFDLGVLCKCEEVILYQNPKPPFMDTQNAVTMRCANIRDVLYAVRY